MKRETKSKLKIYACGILSGAIILVTVNHYAGHVFKKTNPDFKDDFSKPKFEESFKTTKEVEQYSFDYYGEKITVQGNSITVYSFDENGNMIVEEGEKIEIPVENNDYLLDEYISEKEADVYKALEKKDKIKNQYSIYLLFNWMEQLYAEYLNRKPFDTLEDRKEAIYKVCYDYVLSNKGYTMGGYKYQDLNKAIKRDILEVYKNIEYMRKNATIKEESKFDEFIDGQTKIIRYKILGVGRD